MVRFVLSFLFLFVVARPASAQDVFAEIYPVKKDVFVGEEFEIRLRLWDSLGLAEIRFMPVNWKNIDVFPDKNTFERVMNKNGVPYQVTQLRLRAVIKTDGEQVFPPLCMAARVPQEIITGNVDFGREFSEIDASAYNRVVFSKKYKEMKVCSAPFSVRARRLPAQTPMPFPATDVRFFSGRTPRTPSVRAGTPVKRSVVLTAAGTLPAFLPDLSIKDPENAKTYPGRLERSISSSGRNLLAGVRRTDVYIPERAGALNLPELRAYWFDTSENTVKTAVLPAETITVLPAAATGTSRTVEAAAPRKESSSANRLKVSGVSFQHLKNVGKMLPFLLAAVFAAYVLRSAFARYFRRKAAVAEVVKACDSADLKKMETALLRWAEAEGAARVLNLTDVAKILNDEDTAFKAALKRLSALIYGVKTHENATEELRNAFICRLPVKKRCRTEKDVFPELYP